MIRAILGRGNRLWHIGRGRGRGLSTLLALDHHCYGKRSIAARQGPGTFRRWNSGPWLHLVENKQLPVFSRRLREARAAYGISQRNLGIAAGLDEFVASTRINRYETGVHEPDLHTLEQLAKVLELPVAYFYAEDDELARLIAQFKRQNQSAPDAGSD